MSDAGEIRVAGVAPLGAAQNLEPLAVGRMPQPVPWTMATTPSMSG